MAESFLEYLDAQYLEASKADGWQPRSAREADWAVLKIKQARATLAAKAAERDLMQQEWDAWIEKETRQATHDEAWFSAKLHGYLLALREAGYLGREKGYDLPSGRLQLRAVREKYEPSDRAALRAWAEEHGYVKFMAEPDMEQIRQALAEGLEVPGMVLVRQAGESFAVTLKDEQKAGA